MSHNAMFHKLLSRRKLSYTQVKQRQGGFLIPLAAFIIVVMGLMALTISRTLTQSSLATTQEQASLQAFYAGESGAQFVMNQLFYRVSPNAPVSRASAESACTAVNGTSKTFNAVGLRLCSADLSCQASVNSAPPNVRTYFLVRSRGYCEFGDITAERTIEVTATLP